MDGCLLCDGDRPPVRVMMMELELPLPRLGIAGGVSE